MKNEIRSIAVGVLLFAFVLMVIPIVILILEACFSGYENSVLGKLIQEI